MSGISQTAGLPVTSTSRITWKHLEHSAYAIKMIATAMTIVGAVLVFFIPPVGFGLVVAGGLLAGVVSLLKFYSVKKRLETEGLGKETLSSEKAEQLERSSKWLQTANVVAVFAITVISVSFIAAGIMLPGVQVAVILSATVLSLYSELHSWRLEEQLYRWIAVR